MFANIFPMNFAINLYPVYASNPNTFQFIMRFPITNNVNGKTGLINFNFIYNNSYPTPAVTLPKAIIYSGDATVDDFSCTYSMIGGFFNLSMTCSSADWGVNSDTSDYSVFSYCRWYLGGASAGDWANQAYRAVLNSYIVPLYGFQLLPGAVFGDPFYTGPGNIFQAQFNPAKMLTFVSPAPFPTPFTGDYRYRIPLECSDYCLKLFRQPTKQLLRNK